MDDQGIDYSGRLLISDRAHITTDFHRSADGYIEAKKKEKKIGTTKQGIGPSYATKMLRSGLRIGDLKDWDAFVDKFSTFVEMMLELFHIEDYDKEAELATLKELRDKIIAGNMIVDGVHYLHEAMVSGKKILAEGANATMLDIDHGTYPMVTSSSCVSGGICTGLGVPP